MIIFGTKAKHTNLGEGEFYCPRCGMKRRYIHKKAQRYFSLYFIPIIPMGTLGEFVECQTCGTTFEMAVLQLKTPVRQRSVADMLNHIETDLKNGAPIEFLIRDLTVAGLDLVVAQKSIAPYLGDKRKVCHDCGLTYVESVSKCAECGKTLSRHDV